MLDLTGLPILDIAIGLAFFFFLLSIVASSISEIVAAILRLRAKNLETGVRVLLGSKTAANNFYENWRIASLHTPKWTDKDKRGKSRKPSYIDPGTAALAILDTFAPEAAAKAAAVDKEQPATEDQLKAINEAVNAIQNEQVKTRLLSITQQTRVDIDAFRDELEQHFDEVMDRATGWYKRKAQIVLFIVALALAAGLNADTINIADRLSRDEALRAHVIAQAQKAGQSDVTTSPTARDVEEQINTARATGLPLGWAGENIPNYSRVGTIAEKAAGFLFTAFALILGAPFWFDVLGKFARVRSTGNRIGTAKDDTRAATDRDDRLKRATPA